MMMIMMMMLWTTMVVHDAMAMGSGADDGRWLQQLYHTTNGSGWYDVGGRSGNCSGSWNISTAGANPCSGSTSLWSRVFCNGNGRVYRVHLGICNLRGTVPELDSSTGAMSELQVMYLYKNQISGTLPASWGPSLQELNLGTNSLSGSLPASWASLTSLTKMHVDSNQLSGSLPIRWSSLSNLQELHLYNNQLTGGCPSSWVNQLNSLGSDGLRLQSNCLDYNGIPPSELSWWKSKSSTGLYLADQLTNCSSKTNSITVSGMWSASQSLTSEASSASRSHVSHSGSRIMSHSSATSATQSSLQLNVCNASTHCHFLNETTTTAASPYFVFKVTTAGGSHSIIGSRNVSAETLRSILITSSSPDGPLVNFSLTVIITCGPVNSTGGPSPLFDVSVALRDQSTSWLSLQDGEDSQTGSVVEVLRSDTADTQQATSNEAAASTLTLVGNSTAAAALLRALSSPQLSYQPRLLLNLSVEVICGGSSAARLSLLIPVAPDVRAANDAVAVMDDVSSSFNIIAAVFGGSGASGAASLAALDLLQCGGSSVHPTIDEVVNGPSVLSYLISPWRRLGLTEALIGNLLTIVVVYVVHACVVVAVSHATGAAAPPSSLRLVAAVLSRWHRLLRRPTTPLLSSCATMRFPAMSLRVAAMLLPGTSLLAFGAAAQASSPGSVAAGVVAIGFVAAVLATLFRISVYVLPECQVVSLSLGTGATRHFGFQFLTLASPQVEWKPAELSQSIRPLLNDAVDATVAQFLLVQVLLLKVVVSGLAGLAAATTSGVACSSSSALMGLLHMAAAVWYVVRRPFRSPIDTVLVPLQSILICTLCWLTAASIERPPSLKLLQSVIAVCQLLLKLLVAQILQRRAATKPPLSKDGEEHDEEKECPEHVEHVMKTEGDETSSARGDVAVDIAISVLQHHEASSAPPEMVPPGLDDAVPNHVLLTLDPTAMTAEDDEWSVDEWRAKTNSMLLTHCASPPRAEGRQATT